MPIITPDPDSPEFDSQDAAAHALADKFGLHDNKETAGLLFKTPKGKYVYSTTLAGTGDHFELRAAMPKGHALAGIVHSHPSDEPSSQVFSTDDLGVADQLKIPSYVRFIHDNSTRKYVPGQTEIQHMTLPGQAKFPVKVARGDDVPLPQLPAAPIPGPPDMTPLAAANPPPNPMAPLAP